MSKNANAKTILSQTVFTQMIADRPDLVVNGVVQRAGRKEFFARIDAALATHGTEMSNACKSNYYARNKASYETGASFYKHNLTPKQRAAKQAEKTHISTESAE